MLFTNQLKASLNGGFFILRHERAHDVVRDKGVEPFTSVWKTDVLPIN